MTNQDTILSCLSGDLFVEPNLIIDEVMTASHLKALFRSTMKDFTNYPRLRDTLAELF
jgi:hypothetical protein